MTLTVIFAAAILTFTFLAWLPIVQRRGLSPPLWRALIALTFSSLLQMAFIICVGTLFTLDYSLRFATVGLPCCVMSLVLARTDAAKAKAYRQIVLGASWGIAIWIVFITLH